MPAPTATLPPGWSKILEEIRDRLEQAIISADTCIEETPVLDTTELAQARLQDATRLQGCLHGLREQLKSAERLAHDVDAALHSGEVAMKDKVDACSSLRHRLAEWAGRAIG